MIFKKSYDDFKGDRYRRGERYIVFVALVALATSVVAIVWELVSPGGFSGAFVEIFTHGVLAALFVVMLIVATIPMRELLSKRNKSSAHASGNRKKIITNFQKNRKIIHAFVDQHGWRAQPWTTIKGALPASLSRPVHGQIHNSSERFTNRINSEPCSLTNLLMVHTEKTEYGERKSYYQQVLLVTKVPGRTLPGMAIIAPEDKRERYRIPDDVDLEFGRFNQQQYTYSNPPNLIWGILPPDDIEWYHELDFKPWFYLEGRFVLASIGGVITPEMLEHYLSVFLEFLRRYKRSGALEPV